MLSASESQPDMECNAWFRSSKEFNQQIREHFEAALPRWMNDEHRYPGDLKEPEQLLACIIALDQFSRKIYRHDARAFAFDGKTKQWSVELIQNQADKQLPFI